MIATDTLRVLIFLGVIAMIYVMAAGILFRMLLHKYNQMSMPSSPGHKWFRRAILSLALGGFFCLGYGYFIEPYWPEVTHVQIKSQKLSPSSQRVRIAHISDLHSDPKVRLEERLPAIIADEKPDLIVFTGDTINSPGGLGTFKNCLTKLSGIAPTFVVKGNWDSGFWRRLDLFGDTGAQELNGTATPVTVGNTTLRIAGVAFGSEERMTEALSEAPDDAFTVFLYHSPDLITEVAREGVDLYLAGHTHGGQIALPFYGALITLSKFDKQYEAGLYRVGETWLYVNRGIGMEGGNAPRVRFCARPEITVYDIIPDSASFDGQE